MVFRRCEMIRVGIINVTGYAGAELARLLYAHPEARLVSVSGRSAAGQPLAEVFPHLVCYDLTVEPEIGEVDFVFSALPHAASAEAVAPLVRAGLPVVDISADFRLRDPQEYAAWYGGGHPAPEMPDLESTMMSGPMIPALTAGARASSAPSG